MARRWVYSLLVCLPVLLALGAWTYSIQEARARTKALKLQVYGLFSLATLFACRQCWKTVVCVFKGTGSWTKPIRLAFFIVLLAAQTCFPLGFVLLESSEPHPFTLFAALSFVLVLIFLVLLLTVDALRFSYSCVRPSPSSGVPGGGRLGLRLRASVCLTLALALTLRGYLNTEPVLHRLTVPLSNLPPALDGMTVVQLSDIHIGPTVGGRRVRAVVDRVNQLQPDLVVITGDLVDGSVQGLAAAAEPLQDLHSRYGTFFAPGNHDYYTGELDEWIVILKKLGIHVLMNERVFLPQGGGVTESIILAGLEDFDTKHIDFGTHGMDVAQALQGRPEGVPTIVLAHQPRAAMEAIQWKDVQLVLSGHTHAGQLLPYNLIVYVIQPLFFGLYQPRPGVYVYVSSGTHFFFFPVRHLFDPEIVLFTLRPH